MGLRTPRGHALKAAVCQRPMAAQLTIRSFGAGGDPRAHLNPDGTKPEHEDAEGYHDPDPLDYVPKQNIVKERGQKWIKGRELPPMSELYSLPQDNLPFW